MTPTRRRLLGTGLIGAGAAALSACGTGTGTGTDAGGPRLLHAADVHPADYPTVTAVKWMGEELGRLTDGRLGIRSFPSGQLGNEDDSIGLARFQAIDICRVAAAALNNAFPETSLLCLPYVFHSVEHMRAVVDGDIGTQLLNVFEGRGLVGLAYYDAAPRSVYNVRRPVYEPADMKGLKIRAPQSDIFLDTVRAMGANPTPLTFGAVFSSLQTHLIDGAENNWPSYQSSRQFEVARYWSDTRHLYSPADRDLVRDVARRSVPLMRAEWDKREADARAAVIAAGTQVNEVDLAAFARAVEPVNAKYTTGAGLKPLYDQITAAS